MSKGKLTDELLEDDVAVLQIKVSCLEEMFLSDDSLKERYTQLVDQLGLAYIRERAAVEKQTNCHCEQPHLLKN